jgi:hypothetical protein
MRVFGDDYCQLTSQYPIPKNGIYSIKMKVAKYGNGGKSGISLGIMTETKRSAEWCGSEK